MKKFEYMIINLDGVMPHRIEEYLNDLGKQGWELVCISPSSSYVFKREKVDTGIDPYSMQGAL
jgi:hypothetical protein